MDLNPLYLLTVIGEPELWIAVSAILLLTYALFGGKLGSHRVFLKKFLLVLIPSLAITFLVIFMLKAAFPVARPCVPCTMIQDICNPYCPANDPSFPSGHAGTAFAAFTSLWLVQRKRSQAVMLLLPAAIALSRVALGVHTFSDVFIGSLIGLVVAVLVWRELSRRGFYMNSKERRGFFLHHH